ncbi:hypothetical protein [Bacillus thuringiensis]|uniref:hypothetical protein n=1 Tax=Bacillus thuringiensis TaxID=1428 RepID=UPI0021D67D40|nr:hypothetical protein [Bacillus thuringiensis]MCU7667697.1 hypothetical protein [Bacillus thuringiensis]
MKRYTIDFLFCEGNFSMVVNTNHIFEVTSEEAKKKLSSSLEGKISRFLNPYYDKEENKIVIEIIDNGFFDEAWVSNFSYYDETKGEYLNIDGLYPVQNPKCETSVSEEEFKTLIKNEYKEYLESKECLTFESVSYGVNSVSLTTKEMLLNTEIGDRWVNMNGVAIEHREEGIQWETTNRPFPRKITKEIASSEITTMEWVFQPGKYKECLFYFQYSSDVIEDWTESDCKKEIHRNWESFNVDMSLEEFEAQLHDKNSYKSIIA